MKKSKYVILIYFQFSPIVYNKLKLVTLLQATIFKFNFQVADIWIIYWSDNQR